ncbi:MAG: beta strand repeat-containing protein, partial [Gemmataceae bacterium]
MTGFFRSLFGFNKSISKIKPRMQSRRLELIGLEERVTPATISVVNNQVVIQLVDHEDISDLSTSVNGSQITINTLGSQNNSGSGTGLTVNNNSIVVNTGAGGLTGFAGISVLGFNDSGTDSNQVTIGAAGINLSSAPGGSNQSISINLSQGNTNNDAINVNGPIKSKGEGDVDLEASFGSSSLVIGEAGDITTTAGSVTLFSVDLRSAGDVTTDSGNVNFLNILTLLGNININSTSGNLYMNDIYGSGKNLTINQGSGMVAINNSSYLDIYNLSITTTNTTTSAISIRGNFASIVSLGVIDLKAGGNIFILEDVIAASVNAKSTAGDVIFGQQVITSQVGGFTSETSDATKATKISDTIDVGAGANALIKGNLITTTSGSKLQTIGAGNITITGNVDASATGNDLTLEAGSGVITISGNVGSGSIGFGDLIASGTGTFLASGTVKANKVDLNQTDNFSTSITFAKAVTTTGSTIVDGVYVGTLGTAPITFLDTITTLGDPATSFAQIRLFSEGGAINVAGAITGLDFVEVTSDTGDITLSGSVTTSGTNGSTSGYVGGDISIVSSTSGNILLSGNISAMGTGQITINNRDNVSLTINGNVSTVGGGEIFIGTNGAGNPSTGTGNLTINGTVTINAGIIYIGAAGPRTVSVNKALTTTAANGDVRIIATGAQTNSINFSKDATITSAGMVIFKIDNPTNTISFASGANISAVGGITDGGAGGGNLNLANNLTTTNGDINIPFNFINLNGSVSMKAAGSGNDIFIGNINGAQNLTLEATDQINFTTGSFITGVGQNTPLNTITIANSAGMLVSSKFSAANVVLSDTTGTITFNGPTSITNSLTTAAKPYSVEFYNTTVLSGAPVFLNTGNVSFSGVTSLPSGATITGGPATVVDLLGTIVSGGAFNIGAGSLKTNIANFTTLNLTSTTNESTIANRVVLAAGHTLFLNGVGTLTLSGDSSDPMHMN